MHLLQCLFFFYARFSLNLHIIASHFAGVEISLADYISRNTVCVIHFVGTRAQGCGEQSQSSSSIVGLGHQYQTGLDLTSLEADVQ